MNYKTEIPRLARREDTLFVCNHSGGKDSQAMYLFLNKIIPKGQLIVIHSHLPEVEWDGIVQHIENNLFDDPFFVVQATKTFFEMVNHRGKWPSAQYRQCTSDLKRGPINTKIRRYANENGFYNIVNCMGLRAQESPARAKKKILSRNERLTNGIRNWYEYLPIHSWKTEEVFQFIKENKQEPFWVYKAGMSRVSCCFCFLANQTDLKIASRLKPELYDRYLKTEKRIDHTFVMPSKKKGRKFLNEIINQ